jgi:hypothetical protein
MQFDVNYSKGGNSYIEIFLRKFMGLYFMYQPYKENMFSFIVTEGAPDYPRNVSAFATDQSTINVYWNHSLSLSEPILAYTVEIAESNDPSKCTGTIPLHAGDRRIQ